jgi:hypothetical protein
MGIRLSGESIKGKRRLGYRAYLGSTGIRRKLYRVKMRWEPSWCSKDHGTAAWRRGGYGGRGGHGEGPHLYRGGPEVASWALKLAHGSIDLWRLLFGKGEEERVGRWATCGGHVGLMQG